MTGRRRWRTLTVAVGWLALVLIVALVLAVLGLAVVGLAARA